MKAIIIAPRQSTGQLYARLSRMPDAIVLTPRACTAVRGQDGVTHIIVLGSMVESPQLVDLMRDARPATATTKHVTLSTTLPEVSRREANLIESAWREAAA